MIEASPKLELRPCQPLYPLNTGEADAVRLRITSQIYDPQTVIFLNSALPHQGRLLEVGCGHGQLARQIAALRPNCQVIGLDIDPKQIEFATTLGYNENIDNLTFTIGDVTADHLGNDALGVFEAIYCRFTLLHIADKTLALRNISSHLASGGIIVVEEPSLGGLFIYPYLDAFHDANQSIIDYGRHIGVDYDCIDDLWKSHVAADLIVTHAEFAHPTIWKKEHKKVVALSFDQFSSRLIDAGILSSTRVESISASLWNEFMADKYISGGLRTLQMTLARHGDL